ncbi:hypothetical protein BgiMline_013066, partial [Biomphalaria glabrata]
LPPSWAVEPSCIFGVLEFYWCLRYWRALALALVYILEGLFDLCLGVSGFRTEVFV